MKRTNQLKKRHRRRIGFSLVELIVVLVLIGIIGAISGVFMAPMAQSFSSGRQMLRAANSSQFALDRLNQLMSKALARSIVISSGQIDFDMQTGEDTTQAVQVRYDGATDQLLLDGEPLLQDVAAYKVGYTADGVIVNRLSFNAAPGMPIELIVYPRNN